MARLHCGDLDAEVPVVRITLFLASMARLHCGAGGGSAGVKGNGALPGLHGQAPLRGARRARRRRQGRGLFLASMARLHCGRSRPGQGRDRVCQLFLASMARLHCGKLSGADIPHVADPLPGLHGQAPLRAPSAYFARNFSPLFLASMARLHCGPVEGERFVQDLGAALPGLHGQAPLRVVSRLGTHVDQRTLPGLHGQAPLRVLHRSG